MFMRNYAGSSEFRIPEGIKESEICAESGLPASENCPSRISEYFNSDFPPHSVCPLSHDSVSNPSEYEKELYGVQKGKKFYVVFPKDGDIFKIDPSYPLAAQGLLFRASPDAENPVWFLDGKKFRGGIWKLQEGKHELYFAIGKRKSGKTIFFVVR